MTPVQDAVGAFLSEQVRLGKSETTLRDYRADLAALLRSVGATTATRTLATRARRHLDRLELADRSWNRHLSTVRRFCEYLVQIRALAENPLRGAISVSVQEVVQPKVDAAALTQLLTRIERPRDRALVMLLVGSGLRIGEALTLHVGDIDMRNGFAIVRKGRARRCALVPLAVRYLSAYLGGRDARQDEPLFATSTGRPLSYAAAYRLMTLYAEGSGVTMRRLRLSAVASAFERGASLEDVQRMLGHRHAASTARYQVAHQHTRGPRVSQSHKEKDHGKTR